MNASEGLDAPIPTSLPLSLASPKTTSLDQPAPVPTAALASVLVLLYDGPTGSLRIRLGAATVTIGRRDAREGISPDLDLGTCEPADSHTVSRRHAEVMRSEDGYCLIDLGSANGTYIGDVRLEVGRPTPFSLGDTLRFGRVALHVAAGS